MVVSDFDGVFTDGGVYISEKKEITKKLNYKDLMGVYLLLKNNFKFGIISGEANEILEYFKDYYKIKDVYGGIHQKDIVLEKIMKKYNLKSNEVLYIGDDVNDICAMELVEYRIAPSNYNPILKFKVENLQITECSGGCGAIREVCDILCNTVC